jgi:hypothetical protein
LGIAKEDLTERGKLILHEYTEKGGLWILPRARARHGAYLGSLLLTARDWRRAWEKQILLRRPDYNGEAASAQLHDEDIRLLKAYYDTYWDPEGQVACLLRRAQRFLTENIAGNLSDVLDRESAHMTQVIGDLLRGAQNGRLIFSSIPDPGHLTLESLIHNEQPLFPPPLTSPHAFRPPSGAPAPRGSSPDSGAALVLSHPSGVQTGQNAGGNRAVTQGDGREETLSPEDIIKGNAPFLPYFNLQRFFSRAAATASRHAILAGEGHSQDYQDYQAEKVRSSVRALDCQCFGAGDFWSNPMGRLQPELLPTPGEFRTLLNMALDRPHPTIQRLENDGTTLHCSQDQVCRHGDGHLDPRGYHALTCPQGGASIHRSNAVVRVIARFLHQRLRTVVQREALLVPAGGGSRQGQKSDFFLPDGLKPGFDSRAEPPLHGDVVVTAVASQMSATQLRTGFFWEPTSREADVAEEGKNRFYSKTAREAGMVLRLLRQERRGKQKRREEQNAGASPARPAANRARPSGPQPCFLPVGFSAYGAWGTGARHLVDCVKDEVKDVFGPGENGPDEWSARKDVQHQAEANLRRRIAWTLAKWRAIIFHEAIRNHGRPTTNTAARQPRGRTRGRGAEAAQQPSREAPADSRGAGGAGPSTAPSPAPDTARGQAGYDDRAERGQHEATRTAAIQTPAHPPSPAPGEGAGGGGAAPAGGDP